MAIQAIDELINLKFRSNYMNNAITMDNIRGAKEIIY
jgi:hypothetical protein